MGLFPMNVGGGGTLSSVIEVHTSNGVADSFNRCQKGDYIVALCASDTITDTQLTHTNATIIARNMEEYLTAFLLRVDTTGVCNIGPNISPCACYSCLLR